MEEVGIGRVGVEVNDGDKDGKTSRKRRLLRMLER